jgi:hypothetical protein
MKKSHTTQQLLNYFDPKDVRVRENQVTIDAQLLNVVAERLDDYELRAKRELAARTPLTTPVHLDNRGVWQAARIPAGYVLPDDDEDVQVEGYRNGAWVALPILSDTLPKPIRVEMDPDREPIPMTNPVIMDVTGSGDDQTQVWEVKKTIPNLTVPARVTFYLEGLTSLSSLIDVVIDGYRYPKPAWVNERKKSSERFSMSRNGMQQTGFVWETIDKITVRNLPEGVRLRAWSLPFNVPIFIDEARPFSHAGYRERLLPRYWSIDSDNKMLLEQYYLSNFIGLEYIQSYKCEQDLKGIAIEPHTWGMYLVSDTKLYYYDRREPMPGSLSSAGITREPLYGLDVSYDVTKPGPTRYAELRPVPYARALFSTQYRFLIEDPAGNLNILLPDGSLGAYAGAVGWRPGTPKRVSVPLNQTGTYIFTIESEDGNRGLVYDSVPFGNFAFEPLAELDLSGITSSLQGVAFDHLEQLWAWTGDYAVPLKVHYDAYVLDRDSKTIFLTDPYEQVRFL